MLLRWLTHPPIGAALCIGLLLVFAGIENYRATVPYTHGSIPLDTQSLIAPPVSQITEYSRAELREERDLEAQQAMARWAWWMLVVTSIGIGVTAVGVVFIRETLLATRDMLIAAAETNTAARDATNVTRKIGEAQTRAYLTCEGGEFVAEWMSFQVWPVIRNYGLSPAREVTIGACLVYPAAQDGPFKRFKRERSPCGSIAAGGVGKPILLWLSGDLGHKDHERFRDHGGTFAVDCELLWKDVFGKTQKCFFSMVAETTELTYDDRGKAVRRGTLNVHISDVMDDDCSEKIL